MSPKDRSMLLFLLGSLLFIIPNSGITGSAIGVFGFDDTLVLLSALFFASAFIIGIFSRNKYHYFNVETLVEGILGEEDTIVVDTSAIIERLGDFDDLLDKYVKPGEQKTDQIIIPDSVLRELGSGFRNRGLIKRLKGKTKQPVPAGKIKGFVDLAEKYLNLVPKAKTYFECIDYVSSLAKGLHPESLYTNEELHQITKKLRPVIDKVKGDTAHDFDKLSVPDQFSLVRNYLESHYKPSKTDINVLATALYMVRHPRRGAWSQGEAPMERKIARTTIIFSRDTDFREAIKLIKSGYKGINPATDREIELKPHPEIANLLEYKEPGKWESAPRVHLKSAFSRSSAMPAYHKR